MNRFVYLLILLLISSQFDDLWAVGFDLPSSYADENDTFLLSPRQPRGEQSSSRPKFVYDGPKHQSAYFSFVGSGGPSEWNLTTPFTSPPLYVFMSLQL
jgi:hypothetical protein